MGINMSSVENVTVDSTAIRFMAKENESQIIFQRHCAYDRLNGGLDSNSIKHQDLVISLFINGLRSLSVDELKNTYFLFDSSNTISRGDFKRCVETTNIAMRGIKAFFDENGISLNHIINLDEDLNYNGSVHENKHLTEPKMFTDSTGYLEYLIDKHDGINREFWIDFEEDLSKEKREELNSEGPAEIVDRGVRYINVLQRYAKYFHAKKPNSRLIIWCGTHYDLISPLVKQRVLNYDKSDVVNVNYCGGISFLVDSTNDITVNVNGVNYPFDSQDRIQHHRRF